MSYVADFFDSPEILECGTTSIPGSGSPTLQVVASLYKRSTEVQVKDGIQSAFIGLYEGAVGSEVLKCIVGGPGQPVHPVVIQAGSRVSIRNMAAAAITSGSFSLLFISKSVGST